MDFSSGSWRITASSRRFPAILHAAYHVAAIDLQLVDTIPAELGSGATFVDGVAGADDSVIVWRRRGRLSTTRQWSQYPGAPSRLSTRGLFGEDWPSMYFIQFHAAVLTKLNMSAD